MVCHVHTLRCCECCGLCLVTVPYAETYCVQDFIFTPRIPDSEVWPASKEDRAFGEEIFAKTPELITKFGIKPNPVVIAGGFEDVVKAFDALKVGFTD